MSTIYKQWSALIINIIREKLIINKLRNFFKKHQSRWWCKGLVLIQPNLITLTRATIFPVLVIYFLITGQPFLAIVVWLIGWLTDLIDGPWAIVTGKKTELGKKLDPVCDRIFFLAVLMVTLVISNLTDIVRLTLYLIVALDFVLPFFYLLAKHIMKATPSLEHEAWGKTKMALLFLTLPLIWISKFTPNWQSLLATLTGAALVCSILTIAQQFKKFQKK